METIYTKSHIMYHLSQLFYFNESTFIGDLIRSVESNITSHEFDSRSIVKHILYLGIISEKICIKANFLDQDTMVYDKSKCTSFLIEIENQWHLVSNENNSLFYYGYKIIHTEKWKKELKRMALKNRTISNKRNN